jgi:hypothetical protein
MHNVLYQQLVPLCYNPLTGRSLHNAAMNGACSFCGQTEAALLRAGVVWRDQNGRAVERGAQ